MKFGILLLLVFALAWPSGALADDSPIASKIVSCWCPVQGAWRCKLVDIGYTCSERSRCRNPRRNPPKAINPDEREAERRCWKKRFRDDLTRLNDLEPLEIIE